MGFIEIIKLLLSLLPTVMEAVKTVEAAIPQPGAGVQKMAAVLSTVSAAAKVAPAVMSSTSEVQTAYKAADVPAVELGIMHMVNAVVAMFNATGAFQKSDVVQAVTAAAQPDPGKPATSTAINY